MKIPIDSHHVISQCGIRLPTPSHPAEGIEHPRTHEADESNHQQLDLRRRVPGDGEAEHAALSIFPAIGEVEGEIAVDVLAGCSGEVLIARHGHCFQVDLVRSVVWNEEERVESGEGKNMYPVRPSLFLD